VKNSNGIKTGAYILCVLPECASLYKMDHSVRLLGARGVDAPTQEHRQMLRETSADESIEGLLDGAL
jgi:hypothetical protein